MNCKILVVAILLAGGCTDLPQPALDSTNDVCADAARAAHSRATQTEVWAWLACVLGFASITAGSTIIPVVSDQMNGRRKGVAVSCSAIGGILLVLAQTGFHGHKQSSLLAAELDSVVAD